MKKDNDSHNMYVKSTTQRLTSIVSVAGAGCERKIYLK